MTKHLSRKAIGLLVRPGTARCGWVRGVPCFSSCVHAPPCYLLSQLQGWFWGAGGGLLGLEPQSCSHGEHLSDWGSGNRKISQPGPAVTSCGCWGCLGVSSQRSVVMNAKVGKGVWILLAGWWKHTAIPGVSLLPWWSCDVEVSKWLWRDSDSSLPLVNPELASEPRRSRKEWEQDLCAGTFSMTSPCFCQKLSPCSGTKLRVTKYYASIMAVMCKKGWEVSAPTNHLKTLRHKPGSHLIEDCAQLPGQLQRWS